MEHIEIEGYLDWIPGDPFNHQAAVSWILICDQCRTITRCKMAKEKLTLLHYCINGIQISFNHFKQAEATERRIVEAPVHNHRGHDLGTFRQKSLTKLKYVGGIGIAGR